WQEPLDGRTWGHGYYTDLFPRVVAELDPTRFYADGSPYTPGYALDEVHPNHEDHGTQHEWTVWNRTDYRAYRDHIPRFCSEFGFQGPPTWRTLTDWIHDEPLTPTSPTFLLHQTGLRHAPYGLGRQLKTRSRFLRRPADPGHLRGLPLGHPARPGSGGRVRHRALPHVVATYLGCPRLADQRLLAGHLLGGRG